MNKKIIAATILFFFVSVFFVSAKEKDDLYLKAVGEKNLETKIGLLKEYIDKYGTEKDDKYIKFIYIQAVDTSYRLKNYDDTIRYGELAVGIEGIDPSNKLNVLFEIANAFYITKKDLDKAMNYAESIIELSKEGIKELEKSGQDKARADQFINNYKMFYLAPAYKLQALVLFNKNKDDAAIIKQAAEKALLAYEIDKSESTATQIFGYAYNLSTKSQFQEAISLAEKVLNKENPKFNEVHFLGVLYFKIKDRDKALYYFETAYKLKPQADLALKIGQLVFKTDAEKGIKYFADSYVLSNFNKETDAYKYLQQLYFNEVAKGKTEDEKEEGFAAVIEAAKSRLGSAEKSDSGNSAEN